jgi:hypothetical protein
MSSWFAFSVPTALSLALLGYGSHGAVPQDLTKSGRAPVIIDFKGDLLEVQPYPRGATRPSDDVFVSGDIFQLNGTVYANGGTVTAKHVQGSGTSPDHVIIFKARGDPSPEQGSFRLTILLNGNTTYCEGDFDLMPGFVELNYEKKDPWLPPRAGPVVYATLGKYEPPLYCGDALPEFKASLFTLRTYPGDSNFSNGDVFSLDGAVDNTSGQVTAKRISGKGPDHQLVFGNSTCCQNMFSMSGIKKRWPLTIVVNGKNTTGYAEFRITDGFVIMQYSDENAELGGEGPSYERPSGGFPCKQGEAFARVTGTDGAVCAPPCSDPRGFRGPDRCPLDVAKGVTATPTCGALFDPSGNKYCALRCQDDNECGRDPNAECAHPQAGGPGLCIFGSSPKPPPGYNNSFSTFFAPNVIV